MKTSLLLTIIILISNIYSSSQDFKVSLNKEDPISVVVPQPSASLHKYNQQNIALSKIKINPVQPDMNNTVILKIEKGNIDFMVSDLKKDGFNATAYTDGQGYYFIAVDFTGKDKYYIADSSIGLAKYYYVKEVWVSREIYNEIFSLKNKQNYKKVYATKIGTITGGMNNSSPRYNNKQN